MSQVKKNNVFLQMENYKIKKHLRKIIKENAKNHLYYV